MNSLSNKALYKKIYCLLTNIKWVEETGIEEKSMKANLKSAAFVEGVNSMVSEKDFSCRRVLSLWKMLMYKIPSQKTDDEWLSYFYQYTLFKSFPESVATTFQRDLDAPCSVYLRLLRAVSQFQMNTPDGTWQSKYPLSFLNAEEESNLENPSEYRRFLQAFSDDFIYELMKLGLEVYGFNTLDHVCGVHYLSLFLSRQFSKLGLPIDLGRISGAAAGHDIGKYGCRENEFCRVAYLHYYYSDIWFKKYDINYIRHIALNHSTWDLELENLSLESLILIYSDFRVKNIGRDMHMLPLSDSFSVILKKLDNVDDEKEKRYHRVYAKLKDFEDYMIHLGINVDPDSENEVHDVKIKSHSYSLMQGGEIVQSIKYLAINHNINLMYQLRDEFSLDEILQMARSEKDWKSLREYISIFEEYCTYLTQKQKLQTIKFLYEQLTHPEDDIRRQCAELIGTLIAIYDEEYRKETPRDVKIDSFPSVNLFDEYLHLFLYPGHKIIPEHRSWIGYSASIMVSSLFSRCREKLSASYKEVLMKYYREGNSLSRDVQLYLLKISECIPIEGDAESLVSVFDFILHILKRQNSILRITALEALTSIIPYVKNETAVLHDLGGYFQSKSTRSKLPAENYLKYKAGVSLNIGSPAVEKLKNNCAMDREKIPDIFLVNLKTATDWFIKKINIDILLEYTLEDPAALGLHTCMHFCNLLKVSAVESVRTHAGEAILEITPYLSLEQRNEIAVEMVRALEIEGYHFTEYIPTYLGQLILYLQPVELDEVIDDLTEKVKQANPQIKSLLLKTMGTAITNYHNYSTRFHEENTVSEARLEKMMGTLLNGLADYNSHVKQVAFSVIGKDIFGSKVLKLEQKNHLFKLIAKKTLTLLTDPKDEELQFLINSASLNHIYRFISDYILLHGSIDIEPSKKIAFFPGTFDPFTLSHKEIVRCIKKLGFEVYLAVDEFSWSKRTLPNGLRRKIISMSISDELGVYLYPEEYPANLSNPEDLEILQDNFPSSRVYIAAGSDVLMNSSCYRAPKVKNSIYELNHIIIERNSLKPNEQSEMLEKVIKKIGGNIIRLSLPRQYADISSSQIRNYIDENRDISKLVDPLAQDYIYEHGFYQREPQDKSLLQTSLSTDIDITQDFTPELIEELSSMFTGQKENMVRKLSELSRKAHSRIVIVRDLHENNRLLGFAAVHRASMDNLYREFSNGEVSEYIRENASGRVVIIDGIFTESCLKPGPMEQILLTETLAYCLSRDYQYAVYCSMLEEANSSTIDEILYLQGFNDVPKKRRVYMVNMANPCILNLDVETIIKEPFRDNTRVRQAIGRARKRLQLSLTRLYPGQLILSFDTGIQHERMIKRICSENGVPDFMTTPRKLGPCMCVPYGTILDRYIIPNTVTKALHTEKMFNPEMDGFKIGPFPHYLDLDIQVRTIRSFNRPVILVDDLLHKGYRIRALEPIFKNENIKVQKIIVGILSGRGKELMDRQDVPVEGIYFLPRLNAWFNENSMYPFMGGDALWRGVYPERNLLPSINLILPYTSPTFLSDASKKSIYDLSKTSIENSMEILQCLEDEYHILNERNLTLYNLGEVFITPRCPDKGKNVDYDLNLNPSFFLRNDLEQLERLKKTII